MRRPSVLTAEARVIEKEFLQTVSGNLRRARGAAMSEIRHCRHCTGDCLGECLLGEYGICIHGWNERPRQFSWQLLLTRRFWHRVFWGFH